MASPTNSLGRFRMKGRSLGVVGLVVIACACGAQREVTSSGAPSENDLAAIGRALDGGYFRANGDAPNDSLRVEFSGRGPTLLFVLASHQCTTCIGLPAEAVIARDWAEKHGGRAFIVVTGDHQPAQGYCSTRANLVLPVLWDNAHWAARQQLPTSQVSLVVVSPSGVVVTILRRTSATEISRPIDQFLRSLPVQWRVDTTGGKTKQGLSGRESS